MSKARSWVMVIALVLPLALAGAIYFVSEYPKKHVLPPAYHAVIIDGSDNFEVKLENEQLIVTTARSVSDPREWPNVYLFDANKQTTMSLVLNQVVHDQAANLYKRVISLDSTKDIILQKQAPDGYTLSEYKKQPWFMELFGSSKSYYKLFFHNKGNIYSVDTPSAIYRPRVVAWLNANGDADE